MSVGAHGVNSDFGDGWGLDNTYIASYTLERAPLLTMNAALDLARDLDVIGEAGLGLNAQSDEYVGVGLSYYFRRQR